MITQSLIDSLARMAGPDFTWHPALNTGGRSTTTRPHADIRPALALYLWNAANGHCVFCGEKVSLSRMQMCHIVSSGGPKVRRGYQFGNMASGCGDCNDAHGKKFDIVPLSEIAMPQGIPTVWPADKDMRREGKAMRLARTA
jgi:hypothetical protein